MSITQMFSYHLSTWYLPRGVTTNSHSHQSMIATDFWCTKACPRQFMISTQSIFILMYNLHAFMSPTTIFQVPSNREGLATSPCYPAPCITRRRACRSVITYDCWDKKFRSCSSLSILEGGVGDGGYCCCCCLDMVGVGDDNDNDDGSGLLHCTLLSMTDYKGKTILVLRRTPLS